MVGKKDWNELQNLIKKLSYMYYTEKVYVTYDYTETTKAEIFFSEVTEAGRGRGWHKEISKSKFSKIY